MSLTKPKFLAEVETPNPGVCFALSRFELFKDIDLDGHPSTEAGWEVWKSFVLYAEDRFYDLRFREGCIQKENFPRSLVAPDGSLVYRTPDQQLCLRLEAGSGRWVLGYPGGYSIRKADLGKFSFVLRSKSAAYFRLVRDRRESFVFANLDFLRENPEDRAIWPKWVQSVLEGVPDLNPLAQIWKDSQKGEK